MQRAPNSSAPPFAGLFSDVLAYWFGALDDSGPMPEDSIERRRWYGKDDAIDAEIRARFEPGYRAIVKAVGDGWHPAGLVEAQAAIILLDQFPRNMYRGTPAMYASDGAATALSLDAVAHPDFAALDPFRAMFLAMPLMHSETLADQDIMLSVFEALAARAEARLSPNSAFFSMSLGYARRHHEIVARFGRFPHRNAILGRKTTPEEAVFLTEPNSAF